MFTVIYKNQSIVILCRALQGSGGPDYLLFPKPTNDTAKPTYSDSNETLP